MASCSNSNVTPHPTADWIARQITEAFPWNESPRYVIRDRDQVYGAAAKNRLRAMGIRNKPIAPGSPWQNGFAETDRIDPTRVRRPCDRLGRGAPTPDSASLCPVLQRSENAPLVGQRCTTVAPRSPDRSHQVACAPRRTASPIRASLSFRYTQR